MPAHCIERGSSKDLPMKCLSSQDDEDATPPLSGRRGIGSCSRRNLARRQQLDGLARLRIRSSRRSPQEVVVISMSLRLVFRTSSSLIWIMAAVIFSSCGGDGETNGDATLPVATTSRSQPPSGSTQTVPSPQGRTEPTSPAKTPPPKSERERVANAIVNAIESKSYASLAPLMLPTVNFIIQATGCCRPLASGAAVAQLSYLNGATSPWRFDQRSQEAAAIKAANPQNYGDSFIGISTNDYVVGFKFNRDDRIEAITIGRFRELIP